MFLKQSWQEFTHLLSFLKQHRKNYIIGLVGDSTIAGSIAILMAFVFKNLIDFSVTGNDAALTTAIYLVSGTFIVLSILSPIFTYMYLKAVKITMTDLRKQLFGHMTDLAPNYYERNHSGDVISRTTNDVQIMEKTFTEQLKKIVTDIITVAGSIISVFVLDVRFGFIMLLLGATAILVNTRLAIPLRKISDQIQAKNGALTERLTDLLAGLHLIKMFHLHSVVTRRYTEKNQDLTDDTVVQGHRSASLDSANLLINYLSFGGILVLGLMMLTQNAMELGTLAAIVQLQMGVTMIFLNLGTIVSMLQGSLAGASRVFAVLSEPVEPERITTNETDAASDQMIEMKNVQFSYEDGFQALNNFSISIGRGKVAALVGASGSGKSTVIKMLLGFYPPDSGLIALAGKAYGQYTLQEARDLISYVPQDAYLFTGTIEENIRFGRLEATQEEVYEAARAAHAHDFVTALPEGYNTRVGERGAMLSGGQRQRIAIARALLKNSPILLLDEATSALDSESEYWVQQALKTLMQDRTTLVIAHRLSTIEKADTIHVVDRGQVVEQGTHDELVAYGGFYAHLHDLQFKKEPESVPV